MIARDDIAGPVNAVGPAPVTNAEFTRALGQALHRPAVLMVPTPALRLGLGGFAGEATASQRVVGAMFMSYGETPEPGPDALWHRHPIGAEVCYPFTSKGLEVQAQQETDGTTKTFEPPCPEGYELASYTPYMLHVWLVDNGDAPLDENMVISPTVSPERID